MTVKTYLIIALFTCASSVSHAQDFLWAKSITEGHLGGYAPNISTIDNNGNVYITGNFAGTADFNPGTGVFNLTSVSSRDLYLQKLDANGNFIWAKQFRNLKADADDVKNRIQSVVYVNGYIYLAGHFEGNTDFNPGNDTFFLRAANTNAFILKLDTAGNYIWAKQIASDNASLIRCLAEDSKGNLYFGGEYETSADMDPGPTTDIRQTAQPGMRDAFILKLDASGEYVKTTIIDNTNQVHIYDIKTNNDDDLYLKGTYAGDVDLNPGPGSSVLTGSGEFLVKFDAADNFLWAKKVEGVFCNLDEASNIYCTNFISSCCLFSMEKYDKDGSLIWRKEVKGNGSISADMIKPDATGNLYTMGRIRGSYDFDPGPNVFTIATDTSPANISDLFFLKLRNDGSFVHAFKVGGRSIERSASINVDGAGNVYATGVFSDTIDFDPSPTVRYLATSSVSDSDPFVVKYAHTLSINKPIIPTFTITPNPTSSILHISNITGITAIKLTDIQGKTIRNYSKPLAEIDVSILAVGMYLLQLQTSEGVYTHKFVKE